MLLGPGLQLQDLLGKLWGHTLRVLLSLIHAVCDIMAWARCSIAQGSIRMSVPVNHFVGHRLPDHGFTLSRPRRLARCEGRARIRRRRGRAPAHAPLGRGNPLFPLPPG